MVVAEMHAAASWHRVAPRGVQSSAASSWAWIAWLLLGCLVVPACVGPPRVAPVRLSEVSEEGDAPRRASVRLVLQGLEEDGRQDPVAAVAHYERALQVDPTNPWAYLALARNAIEQGQDTRALAFLDQCAAQLDPRDSLRVEAHLAGLRGLALRNERPSMSRALLMQAAELSPAVWGDGRLDAHELW